MSKTYSETHSEWVYDWPQIIDDLEADLYDEDGKREVRRAVMDWVTCACGNQCSDILRADSESALPEGAPLDDELRNLGAVFCRYVVDAMYYADTRHSSAADARRVLSAIEARSAELLKAKP